jgi:NAD(P)-dependent dehydrogenase (short-subunit alcohol dehydrogenase family)
MQVNTPQTAIVTGASSGIGLGLTRILLDTKGGLEAATRALAIEHAKEGIRFNAVAPGIVDTPMHRRETHGFLKTLHPIERLASVEEVVDAVLYLNKATFVTGEVIRVDGGAHAGRW